MVDDSGILSLDFIVGFTIFMISFIIVATMISGLLVGLQAKTIDYDAVAYRTGVILVEDPGYAFDPSAGPVGAYTSNWELIPSGKDDIKRLGLAVSKDAPNILSPTKVERFFIGNYFSMSDEDYSNKLIFGDYPYKFHVSLESIDGLELIPGSGIPSLAYGESPPLEYSLIRRIVRIKKPSSMTIDLGSPLTHDPFLEGHDLPPRFIAVFMNTNELRENRPQPYQIDVFDEQITITITIPPVDPPQSITSIHIRDSPDGTNLKSVPLGTTDFPLKFFDQMPAEFYIVYEFAEDFDPSTTKGIYDYDYDPDRVTQPSLSKVAVLEVKVW